MKNNRAFTLVELIVVITILAILGTIAFISLQGYSAESRDSKRISDLGQIRTGLQIEQAREGTVPMPTEAISVGSGTTTYTYQGYAGTGVLNSLRVSESLDPTDDNYYTYTTNANQTRFQLVAMLENGETAYNNILPQIYADYENRYAYTIGDPIGTLLEGTTKTPVHQLESATDIDLENDTTEYIPVFTREDNSTTSSGSELVTRLEKTVAYSSGLASSEEITYSCDTQPSYTNASFTEGEPTQENETWQDDDNSQACYYECTGGYTGEQCNIAPTYVKNDSFSFDNTTWYVSGNSNVAYTKTSGTNDIPSDLTATDNILVFENGEPLTKDTNAFVLKTVNEGATTPYIYGTAYTNNRLWNEGSTSNYGGDSATRKIAYEADDAMLGDYFQWGRNDSVSLLDTTTTLYSDTGYQTGGIDLSGTNFITNGTTTPYSWMNSTQHNLSDTVTWTDNNNSGVCPTGYHLPNTSTVTGSGEWRIVTELVTGTTSWSSATEERQKLQKYLLLPMAGYRDNSGGVYGGQGSNGRYRSSSSSNSSAHLLYFHSSGIGPSNTNRRAYGFSVRCFKN